MAVIKVNGSLTHGQVADIDRFSAASGIPVDTSQATIVDTPVKDTEEVYGEITGGAVINDGRPYYIYMCATDKDGNNLNVPIDKWNHALDALRYAIYTHFAKEYNYGNYNFSIR